MKIRLQADSYQQDVSQRGMVAARLAKLQQGQKKSDSGIPLSSQSEAAAKLNVDVRTVQHARKVLDQGTPELVKALRLFREATTAPHGGDRRSKRNIITLEPERGNARAYTLTRLQKQRPDLYQRVVDGEKSPRSGCGFGR